MAIITTSTINTTKDGEAKHGFYTFRQNNSGGSFDRQMGYVIVEANSPNDANRRAEEFGVYFNGCDTDMDCSCCGDRWSEQWDADDAMSRPLIYEREPEEWVDSTDFGGNTWGLNVNVVYMDGRVVTYSPGTK